MAGSKQVGLFTESELKRLEAASKVVQSKATSGGYCDRGVHQSKRLDRIKVFYLWTHPKKYACMDSI